MRKWLSSRTEFPLIGQWFREEWMGYLFSYGGLLIDLLIFPLLIIKKTRLPAAIVIITFHLMNSELFKIGIFPWFMIASTLIFFPSKKLRFWKENKAKMPFAFALPKWALWGLGVYLFIQLTVPFRHFLFKGNVNWTEEGHRFAWHMKLRSKSAKIKFNVMDEKTKKTSTVNLSKYLTKRQHKKMKTKPDMILQFAHYLAAKANQNGQKNIVVTVRSQCRLNGRPKTDLIDTTVNLAQVKYPFYKKADWIVPLEVPLK